jgi:hypothetical protein
MLGLCVEVAKAEEPVGNGFANLKLIVWAVVGRQKV